MLSSYYLNGNTNMCFLVHWKLENMDEKYMVRKCMFTSDGLKRTS